MTRTSRHHRPGRLLLLAGLLLPVGMLLAPFAAAEDSEGAQAPPEAAPELSQAEPSQLEGTRLPFRGEPLSSYDRVSRPSSTRPPQLTRSTTPSGTPEGGPTQPTRTASPRASVEATPSGVPPSATATLTASPSLTATATSSPETTLSPSPTASETPTATPTATEGTPGAPAGVRINEVAWAGTLASTNDEWIELYNPGPDPVDLTGWLLTDGGDINVTLSGAIPGQGFFLLERTDDSTISDISADQIYSGGLSNSGESLALLDAQGNQVDSANASGGAWPAGDAATRASMERIGGDDLPGNWATFSGVGVGHDAAGDPIAGTPKHPNSASGPPPNSTSGTSPTSAPPGSVLINEVAWAGTLASSSDEWIELYNPSAEAMDLIGWRLTDGGDLNVALKGAIESAGYFLLERTDETTIVDLPANQIYSGGLSNSGETLELLDPTGAVIDTANGNGGGWPAGSAAGRASMERIGGPGESWGTFTGYHSTGHDALGNKIAGTPGALNSVLLPIPPPAWVPGDLVINEALIRPHYDWEGTGGINTGDEFIELYNRGPRPIFLKGWFIDDIADAGSRPYKLPGWTIDPGSFVVIFRTRSHIALNDGGDHVRLLTPDGRLIDEIRYLRVRAYNLSYGRLPDGSNRMAYGLWPTPGQPNLLFVEPGPEPEPPAAPIRPPFLFAVRRGLIDML